MAKLLSDTKPSAINAIIARENSNNTQEIAAIIINVHILTFISVFLSRSSTQIINHNTVLLIDLSLSIS